MKKRMQERVSSELMSQNLLYKKADRQKLIILLSEEPYIHGSARFGHLEACDSINFVET